MDPLAQWKERTLDEILNMGRPVTGAGILEDTKADVPLFPDVGVGDKSRRKRS